MQYAVQIVPDSGCYLVSCRDFPELNSVGDTEAEALREALDAIETCFMMYMDDRRAIPVPSAAQADEHLVYVPIKVATKVALYNEMLAQGVTKAEMARRLTGYQASVDRILSIRHSTKLETLEAAFAVLGKRLDIAVA